jgi:hypothetical protein
MHALSLLPSSPHLGEQAACPRSSFSTHACQLPRAISDLVLPLLSTRQRLHEYAPPTQPENGHCHSRIQSLILSEPRLHASPHRTQSLQVRAVQSSVIVSYPKVCSPLPDRIDRSCRHWHQWVRSVSRGSVPSNLVQSSPPSSARMNPPRLPSREKGHHCPM